MQAITAAQQRKIHVLSRERGLDDDTLHEYVFMLTKRVSLTELTIMEAVKIIDDLQGGLKTPPGMITERQRTFIFGLARELGWVDEDGEPELRRINGFIQERYAVSHINWCSRAKASKVIEGLKAIKNRMEREAESI